MAGGVVGAPELKRVLEGVAERSVMWGDGADADANEADETHDGIPISSMPIPRCSSFRCKTVRLRVGSWSCDGRG